MKMAKVFNGVLAVLLIAALVAAGFWINTWLEEGRILRQVVERLSAETRTAEVLVTKSEFDEASKKIKTTIKFLEYSAGGGSPPKDGSVPLADASGGDPSRAHAQFPGSLPTLRHAFGRRIIAFACAQIGG